MAMEMLKKTSRNNSWTADGWHTEASRCQETLNSGMVLPAHTGRDVVGMAGGQGVLIDEHA